MVRADASPQIGTGHVMRCLALAEAWVAAGGKATFALAQSTSAIDSRLTKAGMLLTTIASQAGSHEDAVETIAAARDCNADWIVLDGYQFDRTYQSNLRQPNARLLVIDDYGSAGSYASNLVLNQNIYAEESIYPEHEPPTRLLLGPRYALLRREFSSYVDRPRETPGVAKRLLVSLGGSDPAGATQLVMSAIEQLSIEGLEAVVVVGGSNPRRDEIERAAARHPSLFRVVIDPPDMAELMAWADLAIAGAGVTALELGFMGVPSFLLVLAENQRAVAAGFQAHGAAINLGEATTLAAEQLASELHATIVSSSQRQSLSDRARTLVDGRGCERVVEIMRTPELRLRAVRESDSEQLWKWANDPEVRAVSFNSAPIPRPDHERWFAARLNNPATPIFVVEIADGAAAGVVRFEIEGEEAVISLSIDERFRGRGLGSVLITEGSRHALALPGVSAVRAYVQAANQRSARAFLAAGFVEDGVAGPHGSRSFVLTRK